MTISRLSPDFGASPQIAVDEVAELVSLGYRSVMCNRPDGESADQTPADSIRAEAERQGLVFSFVPVVSGQITETNVADFKTALAALPKPVLAYCRSGARCQNLWMLAQR